MSLRSVQAVSWAANFSVLVMLLRSHTESLSQVCSSQISRGKRAFSRYGKSNFVRNKPPVQLTVGLLLITIFHLCLLWGIRLTQGMPTSCGRADPIPADYTACRGHLSEADTQLTQFTWLILPNNCSAFISLDSNFKPSIAFLNVS